MKIPRPMQGLAVPGLGKIFVEYETQEQSKEAKKALTGRTFDNKTVECSYIDEANYYKNDLEC
jgi:splicing factor U2AF 65 kDa subunit